LPPAACAVSSWFASPPKRTANRSGLRDGRMTAGRTPRGPERLPRPKSWMASICHRSDAMAHRPP
jgi:hypothetical protein